jgi:hypothetical protein
MHIDTVIATTGLGPAHACARMVTRSRPLSMPMLEPRGLIIEGQPTLPLIADSAQYPTAEIGPDERLRGLASSLTTALVEVISGQRPHQQLSGWATAEVQDLTARLCRARQTGLRLRSIRVQMPSPVAIEVAAHLTVDGRSRAAALRLVRQDGRWLATQLTIALDPAVVSRAG